MFISDRSAFITFHFFVITWMGDEWVLNEWPNNRSGESWSNHDTLVQPIIQYYYSVTRYLWAGNFCEEFEKTTLLLVRALALAVIESLCYL